MRMNLNRLKFMMAGVLGLLLTAAGCSDGEKKDPEGGSPVLQLEILSWNGPCATFEIKMLRATHVWALCLPAEEAVPTAAEICERGTRYEGDRFTIEGLEPMAKYRMWAVACDDKGGTITQDVRQGAADELAADGTDELRSLNLAH